MARFDDRFTLCIEFQHQIVIDGIVYKSGCTGCLAYYQTIKKSDRIFKIDLYEIPTTSITWPTSTQSYCDQLVCGAFRNWSRLDLFVVPIVFISIMIALNSTLYESKLFYLELQQINIKEDLHDIVDYIIYFMLLLLLLMVKYIIPSCTIVVIIYLTLLSQDSLSMLGNAVAILFILDIDNQIVKLLANSKYFEEKFESAMEITISNEQCKLIPREQITYCIVNLIVSLIIIIL